ncbi:MAG: hypothetical protein ABS76_05610 [Pelagibacterium sp. SCN 64-44]|nr:MAG: hypothetical protein ABS76_05610 [Pelagibacterium sp. SCN 64-44]
MPRPDRKFYAAGKAFGRFGIRAFTPRLMDAPHSHGHIEFNWLTEGHMDYALDGGSVRVAARKLAVFWAGIPHQSVGLAGAEGARQLNIYLPMDAFLEMGQMGRLTETLMGGGVIALGPDCIGLETLERWHADYRSGHALRADLVRAEIATMLRRAALVGWESLLPAWLEKPGSAGRGQAPTRYVVRMVRHIVENIGEPLSAGRVAAVVGLNPNYAATLFTRVMHISMQQFIIRLRLIRARTLLFDTRESVANIAFLSGFSSQSQFHDHFRRAYGTSPSQMRQASREGMEQGPPRSLLPQAPLQVLNLNSITSPSLTT